MRNEGWIIPNNYIEVTELKELQKMLLFLLSNFHDICINNGLRYRLFGGTLLGAIRHHGFIPWDDDVDVCMPREDYEKIVGIMSADSDFCFLEHDIDKNYPYPYGKFCLKESVLFENIKKRYATRLYIDVFPIDGYPDNKLENNHFKILKICRYIRNDKIAYFNPYRYNKFLLPVRYLKYKIIGLFSLDYIILKEKIESKKYPYNNSLYVSLQGDGWNEKGRFLKSDFEETTTCKFENSDFCIFRNYQENLRSFYGDYMKLPPVEMQKPHHDYRVYVSNRFYQQIKECK